jgi:hypothetical protein
MNYENRRYLIIPASIVGDINFQEVLETSADTLRFSIDGTLTFIKYDLPNRPSIFSEGYQELNHTEMLNLLSTDEKWIDNSNVNQ